MTTIFDGFFYAEWASMFTPKHSLFDNFLRGTLIYVGLFAVLRLVKNRSSGSIGVSDLLLVTLTANALQNTLVGKGDSLPEGAVSTLTVFFWSYAFDWVSYRFPRLRWLLHSKPEQVIRDGVVLRQGLKREMLTLDDLNMHLRLNGIKDATGIKEAYIEPNGEISIVMARQASP